MTNIRTIKNNRKGISIMKLMEMIPTDKKANEWLEKVRWGKEKHCPHCGSLAVKNNDAKSRKEPYRCKDCLKFFSVRTKTIMHKSKVSSREWVYAIYLLSTSLKGVSSMKLHRDLNRTQKTAWLLAQKIREGFGGKTRKLSGIIEADETFIGGKVSNMHKSKRIKIKGTGTVNKVAVLGMKQRGGKIIAMPVTGVGSRALQPKVIANVKEGSILYTDENPSYKKLGNLYQHESINHSAWEYVRGQAHTNGIESFWALLKRGYHGTYHKMSKKHLHRYINEFSTRFNVRDVDTLQQMAMIMKSLFNKQLTYKELTQ